MRMELTTSQHRSTLGSWTESSFIRMFWWTHSLRENYKKQWMTVALSKWQAVKANVPKKSQWEINKWKGVLLFASSCRRLLRMTSRNMRTKIKIKSIGTQITKTMSKESSSMSSKPNFWQPVKRLFPLNLRLTQSINPIN